jgi:hypothetical protein
MKTDTKTIKLRQFHALLGQAGLRHEKEAILSGYGVESSKDLTEAQLDELCERLKSMSDNRNQAPVSIRRKRSTVITLLEMLGVYKASDPQRWTRVNRYLQQPRIAGKLLYELNEAELDALARKLRAIHKQQEQRIQDEMYLASNN